MGTSNSNDVLIISTDGSTFNNGKENAIAGFGVFFGHDDSRNASLPLGLGKQTNQRAELMAIKVALDRVELTQDVLIRSDSRYAMKCVTVLWSKWKLASWKKPAGILRDNEDLIGQVYNIIQRRKVVGAQTEFIWVKGHAGDEGNEAADKLARKGSACAFWARQRRNINERDLARVKAILEDRL